MLPSEWRITVQNATGVALAATDTIEVTFNGYSFSSTGVLTFGVSTIVVPAADGNSLASGAYISGTAQTGNTFLGGTISVTATISTATPAGTVNVFLDKYDATLGWPAAGLGEVLPGLTFTAVGTVGPRTYEI
jgi:hypothetical protein